MTAAVPGSNDFLSDHPVPTTGSQNDRQRRQDAEETLRRVKRESESIGSSALARQAPAAPKSDDEDDTIEIWGRRIGRGLGAIAVLILLWQLVSMLFAGK